MEYALLEQREGRAPKHLALNYLDPRNVPFDWSGTRWQAELIPGRRRRFTGIGPFPSLHEQLAVDLDLKGVRAASNDNHNRVRPHQGIHQECPVPLACAARDGPIARGDILGGVLHDYYRRAA